MTLSKLSVAGSSPTSANVSASGFNVAPTINCGTTRRVPVAVRTSGRAVKNPRRTRERATCSMITTFASKWRFSVRLFSPGLPSHPWGCIFGGVHVGYLVLTRKLGDSYCRPFRAPVVVFLVIRVTSVITFTLRLSLNRRGRWGTADDFTTNFLHFSLFSTAL